MSRSRVRDWLWMSMEWSLREVDARGVAGGVGGVGEELADEVGGVDGHAGGELAGEEGFEEEVELAGVGEALDAGVAEAYGFALGLGDEGDVGLGVEGDADAGAVDGSAELGASVDMDEDAVVAEGDLGVVGVNEAGGGGGAADVVTSVGGVEELGAEGSFEGLGGDADFGGLGGGCGEEQEAEKGHGELREVHGLRIRQGWVGREQATAKAALLVERFEGYGWDLMLQVLRLRSLRSAQAASRHTSG